MDDVVAASLSNTGPTHDRNLFHVRAATDPIDWSPRRVAIAGVTGAGKTTLARRVSAALGVPHTELDSLFHGPGWQPRSSFEPDVEAFTSATAWVTEWQYGAVRELIASRADTMLWLDLPPRIALARLIRRTVIRRIRREVLWNGNIEPPLRTVFTDPDHVIRWGLRTQSKLRGRVPALEAKFEQLRIVRLTSQREVDHWISTLAG